MTNKIYRFAAFELDLAEGTLHNGDCSVALQEKPLRLLCALLESPQRTITREQLRDRMWDSRTVVNFEQGINVAIQKVRNALGDSVENPRFIETVAKRGYRFRIPVQEVLKSDASAAPPAVPLQSPLPAAIDIKRPVLGRRALTVGFLSLIAVAIVMTLLLQRHSVPRYHALAVLPLRNLSPDKGQDFLADGITEDLITTLAENLPIKVISSTSVISYKHTDKSMREIARELGVDAIIEGSVARSDNQVRVTVQLIDPVEDRHLWAQDYQRLPEDLLSMESEVAHAISRRVSDVMGQTQIKPVTVRAIDPALYDLDLMGRYHWNKRTMGDFAQARHYFEQAIGRDPNYAPAYAGLAEVTIMSTEYGPVPYQPAIIEATAQANHAIALDPDLAQAHAILGFIKLRDPKAWGQSEAEFRRAMAIDPSLADAHHWIAYLLLFLGRREESLAEIAKAQALDPMSAVTNADEGHFLYVARDYDQARLRLARAIELAPDLGKAHGTLALIELETGHPGEARREAQTALALDPHNPQIMSEAGYVLASLGAQAEAKALFDTLRELAIRGSVGPDYAALVAIGMGLPDEAMELVKLDVPSNVLGLYALRQWHGFDKLSGDARYLKLVADAH